MPFWRGIRGVASRIRRLVMNSLLLLGSWRKRIIKLAVHRVIVWDFCDQAQHSNYRSFFYILLGTASRCRLGSRVSWLRNPSKVARCRYERFLFPPFALSWQVTSYSPQPDGLCSSACCFFASFSSVLKQMIERERDPAGMNLRNEGNSFLLYAAIERKI